MVLHEPSLLFGDGTFFDMPFERKNAIRFHILLIRLMEEILRQLIW